MPIAMIQLCCYSLLLLARLT